PPELTDAGEDVALGSLARLRLRTGNCGPPLTRFGGSHRGRPAAPVALCRRLCGHRHRDLLAAGARGVPRRVRASVGAFVTAGIRAGLVRAGVRGSRVLGSGFLSRSACYRSVLGGVLATLRSTVLGSIIGTSALGGGVFGAAILPGVAANGLL